MLNSWWVFSHKTPNMVPVLVSLSNSIYFIIGVYMKYNCNKLMLIYWHILDMSMLVLMVFQF